MDHPNIIKIYEFFDLPHTFAIVTELVEGGELFEKLATKGVTFSERDVKEILCALLTSVNYYQSQGVVHRDLKPQNIMLEKDKDYDTMKVIDFGTAIPYDTTGKRILTEKLGTPYYIAPEVLAKCYN